MKLYNIDKDNVSDYRGAIQTVDGTLYVNKLTETQLNNYGYYKIEFTSPPNRRYYNHIENKSIVDNKYKNSFTCLDKPLGEVKALMIKDLFEAGEKFESESLIDTGLGFTIKGDERALVAFTLGAKKGITQVRDKNFMPHTITPIDIHNIVSMIEDNALALFNLKEEKFDHILTLPDVASCVLYEATPYEYTLTAEDVSNAIEDMLVEGVVVIRWRNNVKDW